jgi:hypothetical protein
VLAGLPGIDPDALARVLIAISQGLQLQTVWDETVDNEAYVAAVQALLRRMDITSGDGQPSTR